MRFMLDTMIFTHIVGDAAFATVVRDGARSGSVTIVTTHIQEDQIADIRDGEKREAITHPADRRSDDGVRVGCIEARDGAVRRRGDQCDD